MKLVGVLIALLALILVGCWFVLNLRAKLKYDQTRQATSTAYKVTRMDEQAIALLTEVQSNWTSKSDLTNGPDSEVLKLAGMNPSVRNLVSVYNYQMPTYSWLSPSQNRRSAELGLIKAKFFPISLDQQWHVSEDDHLVLLRCKTNVVYIYREGPSGLRATLYVKKKNEVRSSEGKP